METAAATVCAVLAVVVALVGLVGSILSSGTDQLFVVFFLWALVCSFRDLLR